MNLLQPARVSILGTGQWGRALASLADHNGHYLSSWSRQNGVILNHVVATTDVIVSAVSMAGVRMVAQHISQMNIPNHCIIVTATKGLEVCPHGNTVCTPSQIWQETIVHHPVVVLSGPNLSKEIQLGLPAATVVASSNLVAAETIQSLFNSPIFRVYTNADNLGVELGGTLKNVIAIAAGVCDGLNLGTNAKAALVTRGLTEIIRIGQLLGAQPDTFYGLSGLGDLLATCNSPLSRNYQVGYGLGQGESLTDILTKIEGTAEGVNTTKVLMTIAHQHHIYLPIVQQVYALLTGRLTPRQALESLMMRDAKPE